MSTQTETVKACPHGHISLRRRNGGNSTLRGIDQQYDSGYVSEYYCKTCASKHSGGGRVNPHYEQKDLIEKSRRVNETLDYDVTMGYVWSPSHDE